MLSKEKNELLTRVEHGASMGQFLRQYWVPAVRAARLEQDDAPTRVRLFGENFVAFRATDGRVGFFDEGCPHRLASLTLARNEDCALTCIFHGWKIDVSGKVVDVPTEPAERAFFGDKVKVNHYPVREAGGLIWVWLGLGEPSPFPAFEFTHLSEDHVDVKAAPAHCNWVQALEGALDSAHVSTLHQTWVDSGISPQSEIKNIRADLAPRYEVEPQRYGMKAVALRNLPDGSRYARVTEYVFPWYTFIPTAPDEDRFLVFITPIDDEHCITWYVMYNANRVVGNMNMFNDGTFGTIDADPDDYFQTAKEQDRVAMREGHFTGMRGVLFEDLIVQESQGPITDRSKEKLGSSDVAIIQGRRLLLEALDDLRVGKTPRGLDPAIAFGKIHANTLILSPGQDWRLALEEKERSATEQEHVEGSKRCKMIS